MACLLLGKMPCCGRDGDKSCPDAQERGPKAQRRCSSSSSSNSSSNEQHLGADAAPPKSFAAARRRAIVHVALVAAASCVLFAMPWIRHGLDAVEKCDAHSFERRDGKQWRDGAKWVMLWDYLVVTCELGFLAVTQLKWWCASSYLTGVRTYVTLGWLVAALYAFMAMHSWCGESEGHLWRAMICLQWTVMIWNTELVRKRLVELEKSFENSLGAEGLWWLIRWQLFVVVSCAVLSGVAHQFPSSEHAADFVLMPLIASSLLAWLGVFFVTTWAFWLTLHFALAERNQCTEASDKKKAEHAVQMARAHLIEIPLGMTPVVPALLLQCARWFEVWLWPSFWPAMPFYAYALLHVTNTTALVFCTRRVVLLSGMGSGVGMGTKLFGDREQVQGGKEGRGPADWSTGHADWDQKVRQLSQRGLSLRALLRFYRRLGSPDCMPHFSPEHHKTADVVRAAIIPESRSSEYADHALATILMGGRPTLPKKMVSHTWSNLFSHLVAAIVADALDLPDYEQVVHRLQRSELAALESELWWKGKLDETYWVCCFSVDQHAGICGRVFPMDIDPVTDELHPACHCGAKKYFSDTQPAREDGQSINCEMNKFDDMMRCIASLQPGFGQTIAVDEDFQLFHRAWCVAELHQAYSLDLPQSLRLHGQHGLGRRQPELRELRVEDMRASNPADKEMILDKIPDKDAFNSGLQRLIFSKDGLLWKWRDGLHMLSVLGDVAKKGRSRRLETCTFPDDWSASRSGAARALEGQASFSTSSGSGSDSAVEFSRGLTAESTHCDIMV